MLRDFEFLENGVGEMKVEDECGSGMVEVVRSGRIIKFISSIFKEIINFTL